MVSTALFIAILGGLLPAMLWLVFWLMEDRCQPEPKRYIVLCFVAGMLAVWPALFIEQFIMLHSSGWQVLLGWAATEEVLKFGAAYIAALAWAVFDEPLDGLIYMVTAALGFSAMENALFLFTPIFEGELIRSIVMADLRFIGATLLHTLASGVVGLALAFAYYQRARVRAFAALGGVILAIALHTLFNFFILEQGGNVQAIFLVFLAVWCGIIAMLFLTERIKLPGKDYC